jgi:uncharacterized protein (TIGR03000 family)
MSLPRILTLALPAVAAVALLFAPSAADAGGAGRGGGGYHGGGYHGGYRGYGYGFGVSIYLGGGYPYGYYGGYPADYYVAPATPLYVTPPPAVQGPISFSVGDPGAGGLPQQQDLTAHVAVKLQADAEVWFGQEKTRQTGATREFVSPALTPGKEFTYEIKARWMEGGKEVVHTRQVDVSAGSWKIVDFTRPTPEVLDAPKPKP